MSVVTETRLRWGDEEIRIQDYGNYYVTKWFESEYLRSNRPWLIVIASEKIIVQYSPANSENTNDIHKKIKEYEEFVKNYDSTVIRIIDRPRELVIDDAEFLPRLHGGYAIMFDEEAKNFLGKFLSKMKVIYYFPRWNMFIQVNFPDSKIAGVRNGEQESEFIDIQKETEIPPDKKEFYSTLKKLKLVVEREDTWRKFLHNYTQATGEKYCKLRIVPETSTEKINEYIKKIINGEEFEDDRIYADKHYIYGPYGWIHRCNLQDEKKAVILPVLVKYIVNGNTSSDSLRRILNIRDKSIVLVFGCWIAKTNLPAFEVLLNDDTSISTNIKPFKQDKIVLRGRTLLFNKNFIILKWNGLTIELPWTTIHEAENIINFLTTSSRNHLVHFVLPKWVKTKNVKELVVEKKGHVKFKYVCDNKEFDYSFNMKDVLMEKRWKVRVPFLEGIYEVDIPANYDGDDVFEFYSKRQISRKTGIRKKKVFGPKVYPRSKVFIKAKEKGLVSSKREIGYCIGQYCIVISSDACYVLRKDTEETSKYNMDVYRTLITARTEEDIENMLSMI